MKVEWSGHPSGSDEVILAGDVGGTNTTLALVARRGRNFSTIAVFRFSSRELSGIDEALSPVMEAIGARGDAYKPRGACVAAAGPVVAGVCRPTNLNWSVDCREVSARCGVPAVVVNDFTALSYALPLLDAGDPEQVTPLPHLDGNMPRPAGSVRAVVGAGTGLGVGYLIEDHGRFVACPSEGGHSDLGGLEAEDRDFVRWVEGVAGDPPGAEAAISGGGLANIYRYHREIGRIPDTAAATVGAGGSADVPAEIARAAETQPAFEAVMKTFVRLYGRFAANAALFFLPTAGLYLAGGIVAKNLRWFTERPWFMEAFDRSYRPRIAGLLKDTPVYIIRDYSVSLTGAAHAAYSLL